MYSYHFPPHQPGCVSEWVCVCMCVDTCLTMPECVSHNQCFKSWMNWATRFCLIRHIHLTSRQLTTTSGMSTGQLFAGKMLPQSAGGRKYFPRVHWLPKHKFLCCKNKQTYFSLAKMCWLKNKIKFKNVLIITVPILISKDILACVLSCFSRVWLFEPSYMYLKFMVQNRNYICTNLIIVCIC